jgi:predicted nucleotidyltransferase
MSTRRRERILDTAALDEIVRRVLSVSNPHKIILFGSAARGTMTRDSDVDLLVIERTAGDQRRLSVRIDEALAGLGWPFDVVVISREWFEETKNVVGGIAFPANRDGKVIYEGA